MTYFWHSHFTSDVDKSGGLFVAWQNLTWRRMALSRLPDMLRQVTLDPAMLWYLDLATSDASDPTKPPNENYARELMELFTLGPGNYQEADVKAAARAIAGWTLPTPDGEVEVTLADGGKYTLPIWHRQITGVFLDAYSHRGEVTFLGRTGRLTLDDVIEQILAQPAAAPFLAHRVALHFISPRPADSTIRALADAFRASGYAVPALMRAAFTSEEFNAPASYRSLVKSPVEYMSSVALAVGADPAVAVELMLAYGGAAGQSFFQPPNVAGWPLNDHWISPSNVLARVNFVSDLLAQTQTLPPAAEAAQVYLDGVLGAATAGRLAQARDDGERWLAILTCPEFHLK
jgi:uncharacterized protein (DUF1800 family)